MSCDEGHGFSSAELKRKNLPKVVLLSYPAHADELAAAGAYGCGDDRSSAEIFYELVKQNSRPVDENISDYFNNNSDDVSKSTYETLNRIESSKAKGEKLKVEGYDVETIFRNSIGRGHGAVEDQVNVVFSTDNLPRAATLQLCLMPYLSHLQQSLRRASASKGYHVSPLIRDPNVVMEIRKLNDEVFRFYDTMQEAKIPGEDARYILALDTNTAIQTSGDARELHHLDTMNEQGEVPFVAKAAVKMMIKQVSKVAPLLMKNRGRNYKTVDFMPAAQLYSSGNSLMNDILADNGYPQTATIVDGDTVSNMNRYMSKENIENYVRKDDETGGANLKLYHSCTVVAPMSLACFHQSIRQRSLKHSVESIFDSAKRRRFVTPPSIRDSSFSSEFDRMNNVMFDSYEHQISEGVPRSEAALILPHSLQMYDAFDVDGWNSTHYIGKRRCMTAQWEIRKIADDVSRYIKMASPVIGEWAEPQGVIYKSCPEAKKCGLCKKKLENMELNKNSSQ